MEIATPADRILDSGKSLNYIVSIRIEKLFGLYSYNLPSVMDSRSDLSKLLILYGDNGTGKTTILQLTFHLLSKEPNRGHRTFLAQTPFQNFIVELADGTKIEAIREGKELIGTYKYRISKGNDLVEEIQLEADAENIIRRVLADSAENPRVDKLDQLLADLNLDLFYLSADRRTAVADYKMEDTDISQIVLLEALKRWEKVRISTKDRAVEKEPSQEEILPLALKRVTDWIRMRALKGSNEGEVNTNTIYSDIVNRIVKAGGRGGKNKASAKLEHVHEELGVTLHELENRIKDYAQIGLISNLQLKSIIEAYTGASSETRQIVQNVVGPYVNGIIARLNALQEVKEIALTFIDSVNSFLVNKSISFRLGEGIQIAMKNGQQLEPSMLSSGERQLLLLFCNTISARTEGGKATIFFIDEPEISLNVKWQRRLMDALLNCAKGSSVQFVTATHSIELLARHKASVAKLIDENS